MAKKGAPSKAVATRSVAAAGASEDPPSSAKPAGSEDEPKVNLYDGGALRGALDDCARQVLLDAGYDEELTVSNVKIVLGLAAIAVAVYAQFGAGKFPGCWWIVFACVVVYCALSGGLQLYCHFFESDVYMMTHPKPGARAGLSLSSTLGRHDHHYTLEVREGRPRVGPSKRRSASATWSVEKFFHADGYLAEDAFRREVSKLLASIEAQCAAGDSKKDT
ncbi:hypothetical protein FOA52_015951 [Chlamydomonas sp. UWO 241]|nr:hypothetical protein FOA52_015951 [Chlamydomonas sp. UWO 241]